MVLVMVPVMVRFWSVLPERRPVHLLEEPEDGAELGGGAVRAFSELEGTVVPPDYKITAQASRSRSVIPGCSRVLIADRRLDCRPSCADRSATARLVESKHVEVDHTVVPPDYKITAVLIADHRAAGRVQARRSRSYRSATRL